MKNNRLLLGALTVVAIVISSFAMVVSVVAARGENAPIPENEVEVIRFDVSEDMGAFVYDETKAFDDGLPSHGSSFITKGYIYEYGTLSGTDGVLPDGSPEFPDKVIGKWVCRGWFIDDAAHATTGPWVITTQVYDFGDELGSETLVTDGYELADIDKAIQRAITGGTGQYADASGEAAQTLLGLNQTEGVNLRYELVVTKN